MTDRKTTAPVIQTEAAWVFPHRLYPRQNRQGRSSFQDYLSFLGRPALSGSSLAISVFKLDRSVLLSNNKPTRRSWLFFASMPALRQAFFTWFNTAYSASGMVKLSRTNLAFFTFSFVGAVVTAVTATGLAVTGVFTAGFFAGLVAGLVAAFVGIAGVITFAAGAFAAVFAGICGFALTALTFDAALAIVFVGTARALTDFMVFLTEEVAIMDS
jgi:hypothetical protein